MCRFPDDPLCIIFVRPCAGGDQASGVAYFTCSRLGGPLARLPHAEPALIAAAQRVKRFLTGRLDAPVSAYPPFAGSEAQQLAAQARCSTHLKEPCNGVCGSGSQGVLGNDSVIDGAECNNTCGGLPQAARCICRDRFTSACLLTSMQAPPEPHLHDMVHVYT